MYKHAVAIESLAFVVFFMPALRRRMHRILPSQKFEVASKTNWLGLTLCKKWSYVIWNDVRASVIAKKMFNGSYFHLLLQSHGYLYFKCVPFSACISTPAHHIFHVKFTNPQPWLTKSLKGIITSWIKNIKMLSLISLCNGSIISV